MPIAAQAAAMGGNVRVGLEDSLWIGPGKLAESNAIQVNAARQIINACKNGNAQLVLTLPAKLGVIMHALCPELTADLLTIVNRLLPAPGGIGTERAKGKESYSSWSPSLLTALNERAAWQNNEMS